MNNFMTSANMEYSNRNSDFNLDPVQEQDEESEDRVKMLEKNLRDAQSVITDLEVQFEKERLQFQKKETSLKQHLTYLVKLHAYEKKIRDDALKKYSTELCLLEGELRHEQQDIRQMLDEKDMVIARQERQIEQLLTSFVKLKYKKSLKKKTKTPVIGKKKDKSLSQVFNKTISEDSTLQEKALTSRGKQAELQFWVEHGYLPLEVANHQKSAALLELKNCKVSRIDEYNEYENENSFENDTSQLHNSKTGNNFHIDDESECSDDIDDSFVTENTQTNSPTSIHNKLSCRATEDFSPRVYGYEKGDRQLVRSISQPVESSVSRPLPQKPLHHQSGKDISRYNIKEKVNGYTRIERGQSSSDVNVLQEKCNLCTENHNRNSKDFMNCEKLNNQRYSAMNSKVISDYRSASHRTHYHDNERESYMHVQVKRSTDVMKQETPSWGYGRPQSCPPNQSRPFVGAVF